MKYKRRKGKQTINSSKHYCDGIQFKSGLEVFMHKQLKLNKIPNEYEKHTYTLIESFHFPNESYERQRNGKGDMVNRGGKMVRGANYTPDFVGHGFIIECKGRANEAFPNVWKMFKKYVKDKKLNVSLYKPQNQKECLEVIELIKKKRNEK